MVSLATQQATAAERLPDRRIHHRLAIKALRIAAIVQATTESSAAVPGRLGNLSAGGCCVVASAWTVGQLATGTRCMISFPVHRQGLHYPATVISVDTHDGAAGEVQLRLRFRKADPLTQQQLTRWLGELAVEAWHA